MKTLKIFLLTLCLLFSPFAFSQSVWYVSLGSGSNSNAGSSPSAPFKTVDYAVNHLNPGDTLFIMGQYNNPSYDPDYSYGGNINDPHIWMDENSIKISGLHGSAGHYITIKPYDENTVIKGDGNNIIRITNSSYLQIIGLNIFGEVDHIPLSTAKALQFLYKDPVTGEVLYRVPPGTPDSQVGDMTFPVLGSVQRPSYTDTRGMYLSDVDHINISNNTIHHTPGGGLRVAFCEYIDITDNEIHDCSRKSYSGTHGLVVTKVYSNNSTDDYKINILRNEVHHNYNEIYSWSPKKTFINPHIDEGKGISLQRNAENNWKHGRFLVANNLCYWNGYSGVHTNTGKRMDFINNTCFYNSYTNTITYADGEQTGKNIGISTQSSEDVRIINNIIYIDNGWGGYPISAANTSGLQVEDNMIFGDNGPLSQDQDVVVIQVNTTIADPLFLEPDEMDFHLQESSPAIGIANKEFAPVNDFYSNVRDTTPDLGAIEYFKPTAVLEGKSERTFQIFPNPCSDKLYITSTSPITNIEIYTLSGKKIACQYNTTNKFAISVSQLSTGIYLLKIDNHVEKFVKK